MRLRPPRHRHPRTSSLFPSAFGSVACRPGRVAFCPALFLMKAPVCLMAALLLAGCGGKSDKSASGTNAASGGGNPLNAPADYLRGLKKAEDSAVKTVDTSRLTQAIQLFNVEKGRNP